VGLDWKLMEKAVNGETVLPPWGLGSCDEFNRFNPSVNRNRLGDSILQMGWHQFRNSKFQVQRLDEA
jgi:hypothetical protein